MSKKLLLASELRTLRSASVGILDDASGQALARSCHALRDDGYIDWDGAHWIVPPLGRAALAATNSRWQDPWLVDCAALQPAWGTSEAPAQASQDRFTGAQAVHSRV